MVRILLGHILPRRKDFPLQTGPLPMRNAAELSQASEKLIKKVLVGQISLRDALGLADLMDRHRNIIETEHLVERVRAIELQNGTHRNESNAE